MTKAVVVVVGVLVAAIVVLGVAFAREQSKTNRLESRVTAQEQHLAADELKLTTAFQQVQVQINRVGGRVDCAANPAYFGVGRSGVTC